MNVVRIIMNVLPEKRKELIQTLLSIMAFEKTGKWLSLSYDVLCDVENTNVFNLISTWDTRKHLEKHLKSDRFSVLLGTQSLLCVPLDIQIFTISKLEGIEVVEFVRKIS